MKIYIICLFSSSVAAFTPLSDTDIKQTCTVMNMGFKLELGAQAPLGFWDPLGLLADRDYKNFDRLRYVEIKHGRIAMLAFLGQIITRAGIHLPGYIDYDGTRFDTIPDGWAGIRAVPQDLLLQILGFIGFLEIFIMRDYGKGEFVGDFRNDLIDFGWDVFNAEEKYFKRGVELNNGRAAMMGILALMVHEQLGEPLPFIGQL